MKIPLKAERTDFSFKSFIDEPQAVGKILRERLSGNWPGIEPDPPPLALQPCSSKDCNYIWDPNTKSSSGKCSGWCAID